jgi:hypothetical protein
LQDIVSGFRDPLGLACDLTTDIEHELVMPSVDEIKRKYYWIYNETLEAALSKAAIGPFGMVLQAIRACGPHQRLRTIDTP